MWVKELFPIIVDYYSFFSVGVKVSFQLVLMWVKLGHFHEIFPGHFPVSGNVSKGLFCRYFSSLIEGEFPMSVNRNDGEYLLNFWI